MVNSGIRYIAKLLIKGYQLAVSPFCTGSCRFLPTCSCYGMEAIDRFGVIKGVYLLAKRISRCHPWGTSGFDPVPEQWKPDNTLNQ